jgi:hypothetical protein
LGRGKKKKNKKKTNKQTNKQKTTGKTGGRVRLGADVNATGLERSQIGHQPALHVEAEGAITVVLPDS